jgi:hypothetical protein
VRYYHGTACKILKPFFEGSQCIYVDVVGGLVEQQGRRADLSVMARWKPVPFAAGKEAAFLFLVGTVKLNLDT